MIFELRISRSKIKPDYKAALLTLLNNNFIIGRGEKKILFGGQGIGVKDCAREGEKVARQVLAFRG